MIYAIKKDWETNDKLILRYKKMFFQSRIVTKIRSERYVKKEDTKRKKREKAIIRSKYRELQHKVYF